MSLVKAMAIARINVVRLLRDRSGLFFIFVFPLMLVLVLGLSFGGSFAPRVGVVGDDIGELGEQLVERLAGDSVGWEIERYSDEADLREDVRSGVTNAGVLLPPGYDDRLRAGEAATIEFVAPPQDVAIRLRSAVDAAVNDQAALIRAARFASARTGAPLDEAFEAASDARSTVPSIEVEVVSLGESPIPESLAGFGLGAQSQLVLFMFVTSMSAAAQLILSRQLGVSSRMVSTPTSLGTIVVGEALGRFGVAMLQGLFIVLATALGFGVSWGDPLAVGVIVTLFAAVGAGAAMLVGAVASNAEQAAGVGVFAGLGIAAIGGAMAPPEIFPPIMDAISRLTPHRWAIDGLREVTVGGGITDTLPQLGVLSAFAIVLLALATWRLRLALTR
jgi:ABC-2 type transport system permease protein